MCSPRFAFSPLRGLLELEPSSVGIAIAGLGSVAGLGGALWALHRRHRRLGEQLTRLDEGQLPDELPVSGPMTPVALAALTLLVPVVTAAIVVDRRLELHRCLTETARDTIDCSHQALQAVVIQQDLAWGAIVWMLTIPLAGVALGLMTSIRWRRAYLASMQAAAGGASEDGRYRLGPRGRQDESLRRHLVRRPSSVRMALAIWGLAGLAALSLASGILRTFTTLIDHLAAGHPMAGDATWRLEPGLTDAASPLQSHATAALGLLIAAVALFAVTRRATSSRWAPPTRSGALALRGLAAVACLCMALPYAGENAHPVPARALDASLTTYVASLPLSLPPLRGDPDVPEAPELVLGPGATMDGQPLKDLDDFEDLMRRKRELWASFHPERPFPSLVRVAADRHASPERLRRWLGAARRGGFDTAVLLLSQTVPFDHPPLGVMDAWHDLTGVRVDLVCETSQVRIDHEAPHVEALARRALERRREAPCLATD